MKKRGIKVIGLVLALMLCFAIFGACQATETEDPSTQEEASVSEFEPDTSEPTETESTEPAETYTIGISMDTQNSYYWKAMTAAFDNKAQELGNVTLKYLVAQLDSTVQNQQIKSFISQGVDAIICIPHDDKAILSAVTQCKEANIPFLFYDRPITSDDAVYGIATDNYELAKAGMTQLVADAKANNIQIKAVEILGALTDPNAVNRSKAFNDVASENPDVVTIYQSIPTEWDFDKAYAGVKNAFQAHPDINCILAASDAFWPSASNALKEIDKCEPQGDPNHIIYIGLDGEPYGVKAVQEGYIDYDCCQPVMDSTYEIMDAAIKILNGETMPEQFKLNPGFVLTPENFSENGPKAYGYAYMDEE